MVTLTTVAVDDHIESTNPSSFNSSDQYDVFLSFRGSDTRHGFTDHLYHQLINAGILTFRDDDELEKGQLLKQQLDNAIKESSVSIIVFSRDFASSKWCLDEVVRILEQKKTRCNHKVIPIFYHVAASDVRRQTGSYGKSFNQHIEKGDVSSDMIQEWRTSLYEIASLVGLALYDGSEADFIGRILSEVKNSLPNLMVLDVPKHLVGIYRRDHEIHSWFKLKDNNVLLLCGIGGIGKTTIAKLFFNEYFRDFEGSCFLPRITAVWDQIGVFSLQSQLLSNILNTRGEEITIYSSEEGTKKINRALCNKKVLVVLDDVSETEQLHAFIGQSQQLCPGSKILVTSRNMSLLEDFISHPMVHNVKVLSCKDSLELFSWHAFRQSHPLEEFKQLSDEILLRCEGLPLALEVLGSSLRKKLDIVFWRKQMQKWDKILNPGIQKVMKISYDSLEDDMIKNLFLHVACFFVGEKEDPIVNILDHCGLHATVGIQNLIDRCLLTICHGELIMHQVIQDMGREIVRQESPNQPGKRSRLWNSEDSFPVLKYDKGSEAIEGLILDGLMINTVENDGSSFAAADANPNLITKLLGYVKNKNEEVYDVFLPSQQRCIKIEAFTKMVNLKFVKLNCVNLTGQCNKFPQEVRWISWHGFPLESVPMDLPQKNLVALDVQHSLLKQVWKGYMEAKSLMFLNLSYSLELCRTPDFRGLPRLERLILRGCSNLVKVCKTIGILKGLVSLDLRDCKSLRDLPSLPESIVTLELSGCNIDEFPREQQRIEPISDWFRILKFASPSINVGPIKLLAYLPHSLVTLNLKGCNLADECFPRDFSQLSLLVNLDLSGNLITRLPDCIINLSNTRLRSLSINSCPELQSVIHAPSTLTKLITLRNKRLEKVKTRVDSKDLTSEIDRRTEYFEFEGCIKQVQAWNVDRKIIKNFGLESVLIDCKAKVRYEYGIFSTFLKGIEVPRCFTTCSISSECDDMWLLRKSAFFSYTIPSSLPRKIQGLNIFFPIKNVSEITNTIITLDVHLNHKRRDLIWVYMYKDYIQDKVLFEDVLWVSTWKCEDLFEDGDEVEVCIYSDLNYEGECGIRTVYEDDIVDNIINTDPTPLQEEDEEKTDSLRWTDKLNVAFSDYSIHGTTYVFLPTGYFSFPRLSSSRHMERQVEYVDHWGLKQNLNSPERQLRIEMDEEKRDSLEAARTCLEISFYNGDPLLINDRNDTAPA